VGRDGKGQKRGDASRLPLSRRFLVLRRARTPLFGFPSSFFPTLAFLGRRRRRPRFPWCLGHARDRPGPRRTRERPSTCQTGRRRCKERMKRGKTPLPRRAAKTFFARARTRRRYLSGLPYLFGACARACALGRSSPPNAQGRRRPPAMPNPRARSRLLGPTDRSIDRRPATWASPGDGGSAAYRQKRLARAATLFRPRRRPPLGALLSSKRALPSHVRTSTTRANKHLYVYTRASSSSLSSPPPPPSHSLSTL